MTQTVILECSNGKKLKKNNSDYSFSLMGKTQRVSKGYSSGFVPDYVQAVETVGETEGFGSSLRADSEDSCTRKRKCMSINMDQSNSFTVPTQVFSTSKLSVSERKGLEMKLRGELEKVQTLQKKILSTMPLAASGALSSNTDGSAKKQNSKRGIAGRFESTKQAPPIPVSNSVVMVLKQCETLLKNLMHHKYGWVFNTPVDVVKLNIPDYLTIIKHPMDLGTIKRKLASGSYSSPSAFASDVRLSFTNAMTYNPPGNDVHIMADTLNKIFEKKWKPIYEKFTATEEVIRRDKEVTKPLPLPKRKKTPPMEDKVMSKTAKLRMTYQEKQDISNHLQSILEELPDHIVNFLRQHTQNTNATEDEIEIDIESLSDDILFELRRLLDDHFGAKQSALNDKTEPHRVEVLFESGLYNSSMHPCKANEPVEEEVDICGDDPPISSYPPIKIEKDTMPRSTKCSTSSSSSGDSGSSSSESDSGSSSGSESDVKAPIPTKSVRGIGESQIGTKSVRGIGESQIGRDPENMRTVDPSGCGMDLKEHSNHPESMLIEADGCQEGENATSERQVSPEKLYRAALLRGRFADTILKAREKTLNQGPKDPEKLRQEREELERQKKEEKARLQAEARAAENARKIAEAAAAAAAAAEAKRKRNLEREAARQALLEVEKTVEINENSLLIKDLEILRTASVEDMNNTVNEMSPDNLLSMGGFDLGGSNPLQKLGLFMKDDEEEEEEDVAMNDTEVHDVEEGEID